MIRAIAILLALLALGCGTGGASAGSGESRALFGSVCARCHGPEGHGGAPTGNGPAPRNFTDPEFQRARTDAQIREAIVEGRSNGAMPAFGTTFKAEELDGLVALVRSFGAREETR